MNTEEVAETAMPNTIGMAKLSTALPQIAIGSMARNAVTEV